MFLNSFLLNFGTTLIIITLSILNYLIQIASLIVSTFISAQHSKKNLFRSSSYLTFFFNSYNFLYSSLDRSYPFHILEAIKTSLGLKVSKRFDLLIINLFFPSIFFNSYCSY